MGPIIASPAELAGLGPTKSQKHKHKHITYRQHLVACHIYFGYAGPRLPTRPRKSPVTGYAVSLSIVVMILVGLVYGSVSSTDVSKMVSCLARSLENYCLGALMAACARVLSCTA